MREKPIFRIQDDGFWTCHHNGRFFRVNDFGKAVIQLILDEKSNDEIRKELCSSRFDNIKEEEIDSLRRCLLQGPSNSKNTKSVKMKIKVIDLRNSHQILARLTFLFNPIVVSIVLILWIVLLIIRFDEIFSVDRDFFYSLLNSNFYLFGIYGLASLLIVLIHEFGHAVASMRYNVSPKEIGFGFYLYFPVFFTDVSMSWLASKKQRIVVDLAGFYFQIITMTVLLIITSFIDLSTEIIQIIILDNIFVIIYNLNPLFRFDGYWLFSDLCNIPNLRQKSISAIPEILFNLFCAQRSRKKIWEYTPAVYIYSIVSNIFIVLMLFLFVSLTARFAKTFILAIISENISFNTLLLRGGRLILLFIGTILSLSSLIRITIRVSNDTVQLYRKSR